MVEERVEKVCTNCLAWWRQGAYSSASLAPAVGLGTAEVYGERATQS